VRFGVRREAPQVTNAPVSNAPEITVSELSNAIKRAIEEGFGFVRVRGEVSNYRGPHASGHAYFCLKDANARIDAVIWRSAFVRMKVKPQEGLEVVATGRLTTFPGKSAYQLVIDQLELAGVGALMALLEARRKKLAEEGLFDPNRKRKVPFLPKIVGVVTSPTGAVIRDILHRLSDRFPLHVVLWPVRVQGETSASEITAAIDGFNRLAPGGFAPRPDVLIVARGGGSLEDLMSFNEEAVLRAAARSAIPVIAAVGHETDWTLLDHVADLRAPTPTAAAEFAVPVRADLVAALAEVDARRRGSILRLRDRKRADLRALVRALPGGEELVSGRRQRLDRAGASLAARVRGATDTRALRVAGAARGLARRSPRAHLAGLAERLRGLSERLKRIGPFLIERPRREVEATRRGLARERSQMARRRAQGADRVRGLAGRLERAYRDRLEARRSQLAAVWRHAGAVSYRGVLKRGFALVRDEMDRTVRLAAETSEGERLTIEFADGSIPAIAGARPPTDRTERTAPSPRPKRARAPDGGNGQGSLF
jgi:exodeoxyribonuclease VII large subunit